MVNGTVDAYHTVPQGWVRFTDFSMVQNARFLPFFIFDNDVTFFKIATEGGLLKSASRDGANRYGAR